HAGLGENGERTATRETPSRSDATRARTSLWLNSVMESCSYSESETEESNMAGNLERALSIIELLAKNGGRMPLATIADTLNIPRSGTHRLLAMLIDEGYVRQDEDHGEYMLALKLVSLALIYLS